MALVEDEQANILEGLWRIRQERKATLWCHDLDAL